MPYAASFLTSLPGASPFASQVGQVPDGHAVVAPLRVVAVVRAVVDHEGEGREDGGRGKVERVTGGEAEHGRPSRATAPGKAPSPGRRRRPNRSGGSGLASRVSFHGTGCVQDVPAASRRPVVASPHRRSATDPVQVESRAPLGRPRSFPCPARSVI